jgi:hypothetical protein
MLVPTLRVGMHGRTLCVQGDAERRSLCYHAERGNNRQAVTRLVCRCPFTPASPDARAHAPRGNAWQDALRPRRRRASITVLPRGAWEQSVSGALPTRKPCCLYDRSHAPRGNALQDALRPGRRRASFTVLPRGAWEQSAHGLPCCYRSSVYQADYFALPSRGL